VKRRIAIVAIGVLAMIGGSAGVNAASAVTPAPTKPVTVGVKAKVLCVYQDIVPLGFCIPTIW
jgi:hypothetical protein